MTQKYEPNQDEKKGKKTKTIVEDIKSTSGYNDTIPGFNGRCFLPNPHEQYLCDTHLILPTEISVLEAEQISNDSFDMQKNADRIKKLIIHCSLKLQKIVHII